MDITFSGALAATGEALARLDLGFGGENCDFRGLDARWQSQIMAAAEANYGLDLSEPRAAYRLPAGARLLREGEAARAVFLLTEGSCGPRSPTDSFDGSRSERVRLARDERPTTRGQ